LEVTADNGNVSLKASIRNVAIQDALVAAVKGVPGVLGVSCDVVAISRFRSRVM
jgi:hypothetical protein